MKKSFTSIALLLVAILVTIMQVAAAPVENQDTDAAATSTPEVSAQDLWNQYYSKMASSPGLV